MEWKWACVLCKDKTQGGRAAQNVCTNIKSERNYFPKLDRKLKTLVWMKRINFTITKSKAAPQQLATQSTSKHHVIRQQQAIDLIAKMVMCFCAERKNAN